MPAAFPLCALLFISDLVNAIPWDGPRPTGSDQLGADWSPAPTRAFANPLELFRRAGQYPLTVCGFIGGDLAIPALCSSGSSCVWFNDLSAVGCCTTSGSQCTYPTACLDGGSPSRTPDANDPLTMTCPNSQGARECYTNQYPEGYTEVGCGYRSWATTVETRGAPDVSVVVTYKPANHNPNTFRPSGSPTPNPSPSPSPNPSPASSGAAPAPSSGSPSNPSPSPSPGSSPSPSAASSPGPSSDGSSGSSEISIAAASASGRSDSSNSGSSASAAGDPTSSAAGTALSNAEASSTSAAGGTTSTSGQSRSSGPNVGAIAGGAAGGAVVLLLVVAALIWWLHRRHKRRGKADGSAHAALAGEKDQGPQGPAELPSYGSPAPTYTSELEATSPRASQRLSELDGRQIQYQPYRPPQPVAELPVTRM